MQFGQLLQTTCFTQGIAEHTRQAQPCFEIGLRRFQLHLPIQGMTQIELGDHQTVVITPRLLPCQGLPQVALGLGVVSLV